MTARTPRQLAEACYAVARSTSHAGERQAAIGRGDAICVRHGLDRATFDVPGRRRAAESRVRTFEINVFGESVAEFAAGMDKLRRELDEALQRAGAADGETPYDARRRNFDAATAAAAERDRRRVR